MTFMKEDNNNDAIASLPCKQGKQHRPVKEGSSVADLLLKIGDQIEVATLGMKYPHMAAYHGMESVFEFVEAQKRNEYKMAVRRLQEQKLVAIRKIGDRFMVRLLDKGILEYFRQRVMRADLLPEGKFCIVVFDIPEDRKDVRQQLRRFLSLAAFIPIQRSVWASPFDAADDISDYLSIKGGRKWVRIFVADEVQK